MIGKFLVALVYLPFILGSFCLVFGAISEKALAAPFQPTRIPTIAVSADNIFWVKQSDGSRYACVHRLGAYKPALRTSNGKFQLLREAVLKSLDKDIKLLKLNPDLAPAKFIRKLKTRRRTNQALFSARQPICSAGPQPPVAISATLAVAEMGSTNIVLQGQDQGGDPLTFNIISGPSFGAISGSAPNLSYVAGHRNDTIIFTVSNHRTVSAPASINLEIQTGAGSEFQGDPYSLEPYRNSLTLSELSTFLDKVATGATPELIDLGLAQGLDGLVDHLLTEHDDSETEQKSESLRIASTYTNPPSNTYQGAQYWWLAQMIKSKNPVKYTVGLILHDWFPSDITSFSNSTARHRWIPEYLDFLREHAFGNFEKFVEGMAYQPTSVYNLDNQYNSRDGQNQNYAREFLELLTMGTVNRWDGTPNYTEGDVYEATDTVGGFGIIRINGRDGIAYSPSLWNPREKTLFFGLPWQMTGAFKHTYDPESPANPGLTESVLYNHPASGRYIADKIFSQLVHVNPTQEMSERLAQLLRDNFAYELKPYLRVLFRSSAMFSKRSSNGLDCIQAPIDTIVKFLRRTSMPLPEIVDSQGITRYDPVFFSTIRTQLLLTGDLPFQLSSIFGTGGCGIHRGTRVSQGDVWLGLQGQLEVNRSVNLILNRLGTNQVRSDQYARSFVPSATSSAIEVLREVERKLGISLSGTPDEEAIALQCLTQSRTGWPNPAGWDASNITKIRKGVGCLLEVAFSSMDFQVK